MIHASPIKFQGNKRQLMPVITSLLPTGCTRMIDAFGGSGVVTANVQFKSRLYIEKHPQVFEIVKHISQSDPKATVRRIKNMVKKFALTNSNERQFEDFKKYANSKNDPLLFYILHRHAHSNLLRFNLSGEFNTPFGDRGLLGRMDEVEQEITKFCELMEGVQFYCGSYTRVVEELNRRKQLNAKTFFYFDPPYLASGANTYAKWTEDDEQRLLNNLAGLSKRNVRWMLSNVTEHRHFKNQFLIKWLKKNDVKVHKIDKHYCLANSHRDSHGTKEIIVTNY
ncbi:putative DNA adenine methylase [Dickeya phage vB_DsoM_JA29]|uniref:site-specific DNA-methyltransferase (adenine-specific) n=1 Tax=Dickeya phage vB_DsoM_JA29 TaxID=2283031 RepID=A0A384ZWX1_9CAUD|nr:putative DNA adenine methylase [Dickeya phage vB_DsoM_JA29]AXG66742.1 putative DNA adenine methylase [Dickeya phage vB_DsoM_JA29]